MDIKGEYQIGCSRERVWAALNDPEVLKDCIPGCESMERVSDTEFDATVMAAIGPVRARFRTSLTLEDVRAPASYRLVGSGKGGAAGFGRGSAEVGLKEADGGTTLSYVANFQVGGKLAQVGSRLVLGATRKMADDFFGSLSRHLDPQAERTDTGGEIAAIPKSWLAIAAAMLALLIWWFLFR